MDTHDLYTKSIIRLDFWKGLLKRDSSELSFELREDVEIPQTGRRRIPDRWSDEIERLANRFQFVFRDFQTLLARGSEANQWLDLFFDLDVNFTAYWMFNIELTHCPL